MRTRHILRQQLTDVAHHSGALALFRSAACGADRLLRRAKYNGLGRRGGLVFMFHRLCEQPDPFRPGCAVQLFEQFCRIVSSHYDVLPLRELEARRSAGRSLSRCVALTFDDGYADNYCLGLPLLRRYGLPATVFVTTGAIDGGPPLWTSRLLWTIEHGRVEQGVVPQVADIALRLETRSDRAASALELVESLSVFEPEQRDDVIGQLAEQLGVTSFDGLQGKMLTWDQLREMDRAGFTAEPHTITHPILSLLPAARIEEEIAGSKAEIEHRLGRPAEIFAYPRGTPDDFDQRAVDTVRRLGFRAAYCTRFAAVQQRDDAYRLPRVCVYAESEAGMALQIERFFYLRPRPVSGTR